MELPVYNPLQICPALLTSLEYLKFKDASQKQHPDDAYDNSIDDLNHGGHFGKQYYPKLIKSIRIHGLDLEIRMRLGHKKICMRDKTGEFLRVDGELQYYTHEQLKEMGGQPYEWDIGVFDGDIRVAFVSDEWGCVLIVVAKEYRKFGLGLTLHKLATTIEPGKQSGGFTPNGKNSFIRVHREFVRDALKNGMYSKMVRSGQLTVQRVKEITNSVNIAFKPTPIPSRNLSNKNTKDWLLFVGEYGDFILYDKKIRELADDENANYFSDRMLLGACNIRINNSARLGKAIAVLTLFGGETDRIKNFMMKLALSYAAHENVSLYVNSDELIYVTDKKIGKMSKDTGMSRQEVKLVGNPIDYATFSIPEKHFRKLFDRYGEFLNRLMEHAVSKFRD